MDFQELKGGRTAQVETTEKGVNMMYSCDFLAVAHNINHSAMPATNKNNQSTV
jgi:hypothetical protein